MGSDNVWNCFLAILAHLLHIFFKNFISYDIAILTILPKEIIAIIKDNKNDIYIDISERLPIKVKIVIIKVIIYKFVYVIFIFNLFSVGYTITSSDFNDFLYLIYQLIS